MITALDMIDAVAEDLRRIFKDYKLPNKKKNLQEVQIYTQYIPMPQGITVTAANDDTDNDRADGMIRNFPSIVVKLGESKDNEENRIDMNKTGLRLIFGVHSGAVDTDKEDKRLKYEAECWRDVVLMMEKVRQHWLQNRIIAHKFKVEMPLSMALVEEDTYPLFFGEINVSVITGRPKQGVDYVYGRFSNG